MRSSKVKVGPIPRSFNNVLMVGPEFRQHKGGIGAVIETYHKNIQKLNFIASYDGNLTKVANVIKFLKSLFFIWIQVVKNPQIRIIHIHGASKGSFVRKYCIFFISKYIFRKKILYHLHGGKFHIYFEQSKVIRKHIIKHLINNADGVICLSVNWQVYLQNNFQPKKLNILNNPIQLPKKETLSSPKNSSYLSLLFLGKVGDNKGIFDLLEVLKNNKNRYKQHLKLIIGGNGDVERLSKFVADADLEEIVEYKGWVSGELKNDLLSKCDVLVLPSYNEGVPIAILEAMSYSKAILSTTVGGIPNIVQNTIDGFLITPGDISSLSKKIDFFLLNPKAVCEMGKSARKNVEKYSIDNILIDLQAVYKDTIK